MSELGIVPIPTASLLRVEQVAAILGLEADSVRRLIRRGELPARHIGRRWYVTGEDLLKAGLTTQRALPAVEGAKGEVVRALPPAVEPQLGAAKRRKAKPKK